MKNVGDYGEKMVRDILRRKGFNAKIKGKRTHGYDLAVKKNDKKTEVQVKTIQKGKLFQLTVTNFLKIDIIDGKQKVKGKNDIGLDIPWVFVKKIKNGNEFFILSKSNVQDIVLRSYRAMLIKNKGFRPQNHYSFHCTIDADKLTKWKNNWKLIKNSLHP
ncbi:MAG: hypothetical protein NTU57_00360 [Candidatus Aenigmarchaeota archaeon]|nr:hypothetical protein [Candidatus Aenigmarchaeota archaeon]